MSAALDKDDTKGIEHLIADCVALRRVEEGRRRRPVVQRLRELLGNDLARLLLSALSPQRGRPTRRA
jgi:hypothetical protein